MAMTGTGWDALWLDLSLATMVPGREPYGRISDGALAVKDGVIVWVGARRGLPGRPETLAETLHECGGGWMTPGLIDCHSHIVYGGDRAEEFEMRLGGASYEEIARAGGGILSTVRETRRAGEDSLFASAWKRVEQLRREGVTTLEIKSGYGLTTDDEIKMLRVARQLGNELPLRVKTTFLGAHAVPEEFTGRAPDYVDLVVDEMIPAVAGACLADAVDAFCADIAFSRDQVEIIFDTARDHGFALKLHAEQLGDLGGAELAAHQGALSADHLEFVGENGIRAMADAGTVAVLLPGAFYFLRQTRKPPVGRLRTLGVPMAVATDCNPGSSPVVSLLLMMNMACTLFGLTPEESLAGVTRNAAQALGVEQTVGTLETGKAADLVVWDIRHPAELSYAIGANPLQRLFPEAGCGGGAD